MARTPKIVRVFRPPSTQEVPIQRRQTVRRLTSNHLTRTALSQGCHVGNRISCSHISNMFRGTAGKSSGEVAAPLDCFFFPETGMVCTFSVMDDGRTLALAAIGREGFLDVSAFLGAESAPLRAVVVLDVDAIKLSRVEWQRILPICPRFADSMRRYSSSYLAQIATDGACHALHSVQQRVASWLLIARDRTGDNSLQLTHESLSELLGRRRSSVTESLSLLENACAIRCGRSQINILDHRRLAGYACECRRAVNRHATFG